MTEEERKEYLDLFSNLNDEEKKHMDNVEKIMEDWNGELCPKCQKKNIPDYFNN